MPMSMTLLPKHWKFSRNMRKHLLSVALLTALAAVSCSPSRYMIDVEMRYKSKAGLDLTGKNVAVVYGAGTEYPFSAFVESLSDGFAWSLKEEYQNTVDSVGVFALDTPAVDYASRDSLISLVIQTGSDVVLLFDSVKFGDVAKTDGGVTLPYTVSLRCYDAMNQNDRMLSFTGSSVAKASGIEALPNQAWEAGGTVASSFAPQWKHEQYSIYYFNTEKWLDALTKAEMYDWKGAMDVWFTFLSSNDPLKRSCASYNIATACHMAGDYYLASQWLDKSDKDNLLPLSEVLRKRINARK